MSKISDEDRALFREMMKDVTPLNSDKKVQPKSSKKEACKKTREPNKATDFSYILSNYIADPVQAETIISYCHHGIPAKRLAQLKKGQIPWQGKIDLHKLNSEEAKNKLCDFINSHWQNEARCLLVIHGKGGSKNDPPILKNLVNVWLRQIPIVLAFHSAINKDGGAGALYLLLKRKR